MELDSKSMELNDLKGHGSGNIQTVFIKDEEDPNHVAHVAPKYLGTATDQRDMSVLGRQQVLRRNFRFISIVGFGCTLISTWEVLLTLLTFVLIDGGLAGFVWGYLAIVIGFMFVYASLGEMASMAPTSGGQYHWVSEFAPKNGQKFLSFITGWLCFTGWQCAIVSIAFLAGTIIQGLIILNDPTYVFERWQGTMLVIAITSFAIVFNTFLAKKLPMVEGLILIIHIVGLFAIVIPLWVLAPRNTAKAVFTEFSNGGGWSSTGTSVMVGLSTSIVSMLGFDCGVHMSEEIKDASETLPKAMTWAVILNAILGFIMVLTLCFTMGDATSILETDTLFPFIQIFYNTTQSYAATNVMVTILIVTLTSSAISEVATASRQLWSFARDGGVPFAAFLQHVTPGWNIPLNAVLVSLIVTVLLSLINIGSTVALDAIISLTIGSLVSSYMITITCILMKRIRKEPLPARRWTLGRYGFAVNVGALLFLMPIFIFSFFPLATPVQASTMNWGVVIYSGIIIFATVYYFLYARHVYVPPVALVKRDL
uniref:Putative GABA permease n=1 Tax=Cladonia uncialis subsp. uncialis TaxID=180999 RepID=A0A2K9YE81_CLAUC|nr:putative GABA permease [Cladonia uncialis subsp. uncialis]